MKLVQFVGLMGIPSQSSRSLDKVSLERLKVDVPDSLLDDAGNLVFGPSTNHTIEMSNEASESLVAALPGEFKIIGENQAVEQQALPMTDNPTPQADAEKPKSNKKKDDSESSDDA